MATALLPSEVAADLNISTVRVLQAAVASLYSLFGTVGLAGGRPCSFKQVRLHRPANVQT